MSLLRKKNKLFYVIFFIILSFSCYKLERWCHAKTEGFRVSNLFLKEPITGKDREIELPENLQKEAFQQPYFFLASGGESYVFESQDKKWVLKFFKNHHF